MEKELEEQFSLIAQKIDDQFRFTRNVIVLCTLTIIGVMVFTITATFNSLPTQIIFHYMSNLDGIVAEWKACEYVMNKRKKSRMKTPPSTESTEPPAKSNPPAVTK